MPREEESIVIEASSTAQNTFNPIRNIVDRIKVEPNPEKAVISVSLGDPTVFGNLKTAETVKNAMIKAVEDGKADGYAPSVGTTEARQAISSRYNSRFNVNFDTEDIFIASGCSGALDLAISVLCGPGDALLVPKPGFTLYATLAGSKGIKSLSYPLDENENWQIKLDGVEKILEENRQSIKAWLINNPSNPCGSVYSRDHLLDCLKLAKKYDIPVIADEIYEDMVFSGNDYIPIARMCQENCEVDVPVLTCSGLAKRFLVPGWRFGWVAIHTAKGYNIDLIRRGLFDLSTLIIGACTLIQAALPTIFSSTPDSFYTETNEHLEGNAALLANELAKIRGLKVIKPQGTMYMLVGVDLPSFGFKDDVEVSEALLADESVSVLPGSIFGMEGYFRIVYSAPKEALIEFASRLRGFFENRRLK